MLKKPNWKKRKKKYFSILCSLLSFNSFFFVLLFLLLRFFFLNWMKRKKIRSIIWFDQIDCGHVHFVHSFVSVCPCQQQNRIDQELKQLTLIYILSFQKWQNIFISLYFFVCFFFLFSWQFVLMLFNKMYRLNYFNKKQKDDTTTQP